MVQLFKKLSGGNIGANFKKVSGDINSAFKKGGNVEKTLGKVGSALEKGAVTAGKIASAGSQILGQVQASPLGAFVPTPVFGVAQSALKGVSALGKVSGAGAGISKDLTSGKGVKDISKNVIEKVVKTKEEVGPAFR
jgi:hypothetical protein